MSWVSVLLLVHNVCHVLLFGKCSYVFAFAIWECYLFEYECYLFEYDFFAENMPNIVFAFG